MTLSCGSTYNWFNEYTTSHITVLWTSFFTNRWEAAARDLTMWLLDSIFFIVVMPKFLLTVSIFLDLRIAKNNWHLPTLDLLSKYCVIIWEQWQRIVHLSTLYSMEFNSLSSTCMRLGVLFHFDARYFIVWNVGVTFTSTTC